MYETIVFFSVLNDSGWFVHSLPCSRMKVMTWSIHSFLVVYLDNYNNVDF